MNTILGLDPGRDKCGLAVINDKQVVYHQVVDSAKAIAIMEQLCQDYGVDLIVMGDGTTSKAWYEKIESHLTKEIPVVTVNEKNSTLEARDRYWLIYPPQGLQRLIPQGLRVPPRPVDDIVAILLIERYSNLKN
ncbi:pre-16S rRNA-processing nuclease YqgF [Waterburya agarophytonicola K14]|uniref:Pre-16S rRNA-processing nuclease YqgF n=1 Tax=Waterburya agarophytonicola KI4 TaxID=2874699 RepID=A0A964BQM3_9CYAN|nr:pre-16S rRNA-processing nuclease YqgF [Waterburya agarophytonicola]MCC0176693.1 pre-16S rRNA-processing nuclease YqgF [Waterburya agarophytonicola KI4]